MQLLLIHTIDYASRAGFSLLPFDNVIHFVKEKKRNRISGLEDGNYQ